MRSSRRVLKIRQVTWANYRRMPDGNIVVRDHLVLVGPNDSGKSSVLRSIHLCIGMAHGQVANSISARDFTNAQEPLVLTVTLDGIDDDDRAAFPDEISVGPPETLVVAVAANVDPADPDQIIVRRFFPDSGHLKAPTKEQLATIGFQYVPAVRSLLRELGGASGGAVKSLLSGLDLTADAAALTAAADGYRAALDGSAALAEFRVELADALTAALPTPIEKEDVRVVSEAEVLDDPLSGVTVTVRDGDHDVPLLEQSDGIRALSVLTLLGLSHKTAQIVAIDEPETHLHPAAQRSVTKALRADAGQRVLVTHSPSVVGVMSPMDIATFRADRSVRQLAPGAAIAAESMTVRHWSHRLIEPLTARKIVIVEGVSDQILFERVAQLTGNDLDRAGVATFELGGASSFPTAYDVLGPPGFDLTMVGMVDEDARGLWADAVGVPHADLEDAGYVVCDADLEEEYINALGVPTVLAMLLASPSISENSLLTSCNVATHADVTAGLLRGYCNHKKHKVAAALAVAAALDGAQAGSIASLVDLVALVV